jgi:phosphoglycolate phosphatase
VKSEKRRENESAVGTIGGVVFDLDGTLLDTLEDIADSANIVLAERGHPVHTVDAYKYFVGDGAPTLIHRILPEKCRTAEEEALCIQRYRDVYAVRWNLKTAAYPGIRAMLAALASRAMKLAVLSNKPHDATEECVQGFLGEVTFDVVQGQSTTYPKKPDPSGALAIARVFGISPAECLYVGDTATDMQTALRAGMIPVGVLWGFRPADELSANGAKRLVAHPSELIPLLEDRTLVS